MKTFKQFITEGVKVTDSLVEKLRKKIRIDNGKKHIINGVMITFRDLKELPDLSDVIVDGDYDCSSNNLHTLKGSPKQVHGSFNCSWNKLTSLEGAPEFVNGIFYCNQNPLKSLEGAPEGIYSFKSDQFTHQDYLKYWENKILKRSIDPETNDLFGGMLDTI